MNFKLGNFLSLSCFRGLFGQVTSMIATMCAVWIFSFILIAVNVLNVHYVYGIRTCGREYLPWNVLLVTLLYLTSILSILRVRCLAVKYLQR